MSSVAQSITTTTTAATPLVGPSAQKSRFAGVGYMGGAGADIATFAPSLNEQSTLTSSTVHHPSPIVAKSNKWILWLLLLIAALVVGAIVIWLVLTRLHRS